MTHVPTLGTDALDRRRIGVVLLDYEWYTEDSGDFGPEDRDGLGQMPPGFFESPASWPLPTSFIVARGATAKATVTGEPVARQAFARAACELHGRCGVVVADCGFMWAARHDPEIELPPGTVASGLDLLAHAGELVSGPIGILTFSSADLEQLLVGHPLADRLRLVDLQDLPGWDAFWGGVEPADIDMARVRDGLADHVRAELAGGQLADVEAIVLECTVLPQLRPTLREITALPIFDAMTYACAPSA